MTTDLRKNAREWAKKYIEHEKQVDKIGHRFMNKVIGHLKTCNRILNDDDFNSYPFTKQEFQSVFRILENMGKITKVKNDYYVKRPND